MLKKVIKFFIKLSDDMVNAHAASAAFFVFLSIFPILMIACSILPLTPLDASSIIGFVNEHFPDWARKISSDIIRDVFKLSPAIFSFSIVMALWSCARGMLSLVTGFNAAEGVKETRNYFRVRFWCIIYTLMLLSIILILITFIVFGRSIVEWLMDYFPVLSIVLSVLFSLRYVIVFVVMMLIFSCMYYFMPNKRSSSFILKMPGAFIAALAWSVLSWGFSIYVEILGSINMYGSLTTIVLLLFWLFLCMFFLLLGNELNVFFNYYIALAVVKYKYREKHKIKQKIKEKIYSRQDTQEGDSIDDVTDTNNANNTNTTNLTINKNNN